jgi:tetratricopeptide (TPR) repeat protein
VLLFFALGLMCKPMLVTLPLVLLLLDYWPLRRISEFGVRSSELKNTLHSSTLNSTPNAFGAQLSTLLLEKLPLLGLAVASCAVTIFTQHGVIQPFENISFPLRVGNALISYVAYLGQMFWPAGLAVLYPFTAGDFGVSEVVLSLVLLAGITAGVFVLRRRLPCLLTGWLWYLIMLAPVIGIVQVGSQARADRYTYLPQIGLYVLLTWGAAELCAGWRHRRLVLGGGTMVILAALIFCARTQTAYWRDSETLWTHTLACTSDNLMGHNNLGAVLLQKGNVDGAMVHFQTALQINPDYAEAHYNFGMALNRMGNVDEAIAQYQTALQLKPGYAKVHNNLGNALLQKGNVNEAIAQYQTALQIKPDYADAHNNLGNALLKTGNVSEAIAQYQTARQIDPGSAEACYNLGNALLRMNNVDEAMVYFQKALQIKPDYADAHNNLGNALLQKGNVGEAMVHFQTALQINPGSAEASYNLGNALFQKGRVDEAITHYQKALQIKPASAEACYNLGNALLQKGRVDEAITQYQKALQIKPDSADAHNNLGNILLKMGNVDEAITHYQQALQINPHNAVVRNNLGNALLQKSNVDDAITRCQKTLQIKPDSPEVLNNLAWLLATCPDAHVRDGVQAVQYAERACELTHYGVTLLVGTLAAAYAEAGRYDDAMAAAEKACALATAAGERDLLEKNRKLLALYRAHQPYHEAAGKVVPAAPEP